MQVGQCSGLVAPRPPVLGQNPGIHLEPAVTGTPLSLQHDGGPRHPLSMTLRALVLSSMFTYVILSLWYPYIYIFGMDISLLFRHLTAALIQSDSP